MFKALLAVLCLVVYARSFPIVVEGTIGGRAVHAAERAILARGAELTARTESLIERDTSIRKIEPALLGVIFAAHPEPVVERAFSA
ncbi:hypothetical protein K438DRAFT_1970717 [Mycena galopus ATCC 62051]|nr:hypothetical protein K438DRAFT_1970717 [Mycena galopus ATCC 62051]